MRLRYGIIALVCVGAVAWMVVLLQRNVVFFKTVSQAVHDERNDGTRSMRIGGGVVAASIQRRADGVDFELYEGGATVHVHHTGESAEAIASHSSRTRRLPTANESSKKLNPGIPSRPRSATSRATEAALR